MELKPAKCSLKIVRSTDLLGCPTNPLSGGYTVHPVPTPPPTINLEINKKSDGGNNQNLILFIRGNAISGAPNMVGTNQFPKPPIITGIIMKKIIKNA